MNSTKVLELVKTLTNVPQNTKMINSNFYALKDAKM